MDNRILVNDKYFVPYITHDKIMTRVDELAAEVRTEFDGKRPLFLGILNGVFMFAADFIKAVNIDCEISFVKLTSYAGMETTGAITSRIGLEIDIKDRHVILMDDIVDSGITLHHLYHELLKENPASLNILTLLMKPDALQKPLDVTYVGFDIPNKFVIGYGLDYDQSGRYRKDIYQLDEQA